MSYESQLVLHGAVFPQEPRRYYQKRRNKHSSGSAEWHSRKERERQIQRTVAAYRPVGRHNWLAFQRRLSEAMS